MSRKGFLLQESDGEWSVQWSDLSSFAQGKHWCFTKLAPESNSIKVIVGNTIQYKPLSNREYVEFEFITVGYDDNDFAPKQLAKLVYEEAEKLERDIAINEYLKNGGDLFNVISIDSIRDGGTLVLNTSSINYPKIYIHHKTNEWYSNYPMNNESFIIDNLIKIYTLDRLHKYHNHLELLINKTNSIINNIKA
jgi:hypothetical protein